MQSNCFWMEINSTLMCKQERIKISWYFKCAPWENVSQPTSSNRAHMCLVQSCRNQRARAFPNPRGSMLLSACKCFGYEWCCVKQSQSLWCCWIKKKKKKPLYNLSFLSRERPHGFLFPFSKNLCSHLRFRIENWFLFVLPVYRFSLSSGTSVCTLALTFVLQLSKVCHTLCSD